MARAIDQQHKDCYQLVKFTYGDSSTKAYTNWTEDIDGTPEFEATPAMEVTLPENTGTLEDNTLIIRMVVDSFNSRLASGVPHSPCYVEVWDTTSPSDPSDDPTTLKVFAGWVTRTVRNPNGRKNQVEIRSQLQKCRLDVPLGVPANHQCDRTLGIGLCHATRVERTGLVVSAIYPRKLVVASLVTTSLEDRHFHRGYLVLDNLRLTIREWRLADPTAFYLSRQAPADWLGEEITAVSGCDKTIETCRRRYDAEEDFFGLGYAIPPYNPQMENLG